MGVPTTALDFPSAGRSGEANDGITVPDNLPRRPPGISGLGWMGQLQCISTLYENDLDYL